MVTIDLHKTLNGPWEDGTRPSDLFHRHISSCPEAYVLPIVEGLACGVRRVENGCAELASLLSEQTPELLYSHIDHFITCLHSKEKIKRWEAVCTLGYLATCDSAARNIPPHIETLIAFLTNKSIVLQGHTLRALARIAVAHPDTATRIHQSIIASAPAFPGNKIGFVIEALTLMAPLQNLRPGLITFITDLRFFHQYEK